MEALLLKPEEVAECLNGGSKVYELMRAGALESVRVGARPPVPRTAVDAYIEHLLEQTAASCGPAPAAMKKAQRATNH